MKVLCVLGKHQYGDPTLGLGTEYIAFTSALRRLGNEVLHFESWDRREYRSLADLNCRLFKLVQAERPEVLLSVQSDYEVWTETLDAIGALGTTATVSWATDDSWKYREVSRFVGRHYHAVATTYESALSDYRRDGIDWVLATQWAANSEWLHEPMPAVGCRYGVSFVGAAYGDRPGWIAELRNRGIYVECFGRGWQKGSVPAGDLPRIFGESLVSLNFADGFKVGSQSQIKARTFEVPGAGGLLLTGYAPQIERWYEPGKEILVFRDLEDLVDQVRRIQRNPEMRDAIARAGFLRTARDHTYDRRLADVLDFAMAARRARTGRTVAVSMEDAVLRHRPGRLIRGFRSLLLWICTLVWGRIRGKRAARRILFEASWRFAGASTFRSSGLPGRTFPEL